jgi:hypothetical protein
MSPDSTYLPPYPSPATGTFDNGKPPAIALTLISYDSQTNALLTPGCLLRDDSISLWCHRVAACDCTPDLIFPLDTTSTAPLGSLLDPQLDITSNDLNDLPLFGFETLERADDRPDFSFTSFGDILSTLRQGTLLPFRSDMRVNFWQSKSSLADGGANVCMTTNPDLLLDVVQINPVPLGTAVDPAT